MKKERKMLSSQFVNSFLSSQDFQRLWRSHRFCCFVRHLLTNFQTFLRPDVPNSRPKQPKLGACEWKKVRLIYDSACSGNRSLPEWMSSEFCLWNVTLFSSLKLKSDLLFWCLCNLQMCRGITNVHYWSSYWNANLKIKWPDVSSFHWNPHLYFGQCEPTQRRIKWMLNKTLLSVLTIDRLKQVHY